MVSTTKSVKKSVSQTKSVTKKTTSSEKSKERITKDMLIGDIVGKYPATIEPLMKSGLHCIGCGAAKFETLEQGLQAHGKTEQEIAALLKELNAVLPEVIGDAKKIQITTPALTEALKAVKEQNAQSIRISIAEGCCGSSFALGLDTEKPSNDDEVITIKGLTIVCKKSEMKQLSGTIIDYVKSVRGEGFIVSNPNQVQEPHGGGCC